MSLHGIAVIPILIWVYLLTARGGFWRVSSHLARELPPADARHVVALIPARNEAQVIGTAVASLARQSFSANRVSAANVPASMP